MFFLLRKSKEGTTDDGQQTTNDPAQQSGLYFETAIQTKEDDTLLVCPDYCL